MNRPDPISAPFGAFALSGLSERMRRLPMVLPADGLRRAAESLVRRALMSGGREIADVEVFPGQFARLHLRDNRCEKRVFAGSRAWDDAERSEIRQRTRRLSSSTPGPMPASTPCPSWPMPARSANRSRWSRWNRIRRTAGVWNST